MTDRGSATILAIAVASVTAVAGIALIAMFSLAADRVSAQTAADAAALAAAPATFDGSAPAAAARLAGLNGARLLRCRCPFDPRPAVREVEVEVAVDSVVPLLGPVVVRATARAEFVPSPASSWTDGEPVP